MNVLIRFNQSILCMSIDHVRYVGINHSITIFQGLCANKGAKELVFSTGVITHGKLVDFRA